MCNKFHRKHFFVSDSSESLPKTLGPDLRSLPPRSKSITGRLSHLNAREAYGNELPVYKIQRHNTHLTLASIITFFVLVPLLGAVVYQRKADMNTLNKIKEDIAHHLQQITDVSDYTKSELGKTLLYGDIDAETQVVFLEEERLQMQQGIQLQSQRMLREKYGPGPKYRVEMRLAFDPTTNPEILVIETASIQQMPASIFYFLELVSHGTYDGTPFHRIADHIAQAGPSVLRRDSTSVLYHDPTLAKIAFQEYSTEMPHAKYTLGIPGRPGGPDFYINVRDNERLHGPGGQTWHYGDITDDADPCFATVIEGRRVIDHLQQTSGHGHPVVIDEMRIVNDLNPTQTQSPLRSAKRV